MCRLIKALYGHPESGGHWERHLEEAIMANGGTKMPNCPSSYWFEELKLALTVYVDDVMLAGPAGNHDALWKKLRYGSKRVDLEDPEPLSRFLGREHVKL